MATIKSINIPENVWEMLSERARVAGYDSVEEYIENMASELPKEKGDAEWQPLLDSLGKFSDDFMQDDIEQHKELFA